jgi:putative acetyltransferase
MTTRIRPETGDDEEPIDRVNRGAFPTAQEARLVKALRAAGDCELSLIAEDGGEIVGHVMLSRMRVEGDGKSYRALGLGPVAVLPDRQRSGIGSALIEAALDQAEDRGEEIVFLLGEPDYYRRFGFSAEAAAPFASPYAGPYFMARAIVPLPQSGKAAYAPAFDSLS